MEFVLRTLNSNATRMRLCMERSGEFIRLSYETETTPDLVWPTFRGLERAHEIWRSTCCELFVGLPESEGYLEINLSPDGRWNCYRFDSYRSGMAESEHGPINLSSGPGWLTSDWQLALAPKIYLGPAAILEKRNGLDYFALQHGSQPDFHDRRHHVLVALNDL